MLDKIGLKLDLNDKDSIKSNPLDQLELVDRDQKIKDNF
jgi:hypothetical protein